MAFTRMDTGTAEDWSDLQQANEKWQSSIANRIKFLLAKLAEQRDGMAIDQLQHSLQTATRALRDGASEELIVAALCHDIGTSISSENHAAIAAEILRPYVSRDVCEIVRTHQEFQQSHYHEQFGRNTEARRRYAKKPWFRAAERFSDDWDQIAFDPDYETLPLAYFAPLLDGVFKTPRGRLNARRADSAEVRVRDRSSWLKRVKRLVSRGQGG